MKTFLKTGVLLVSLGALASSPDPSFYQYWFDKDESSRARNTHVYDAQSNPLTIDASGLSEGGHTVNYRMADKDKRWGTVMTRYFVVPYANLKDPKDATEPVLMQYWFDNDEASRIKNTQACDSQSDSFEVDAASLSPGGHALKYRMANKFGEWGSVMTRYFNIPIAHDRSSSKAVAYRVWVNNDIVATGSVPNGSEFTLTAGIPGNPSLSKVKSRVFAYRAGERTVSMAASGTFFCAFQMLSESNEWGMPLYSEYEHSVTVKLPVDSIAVPCDYTFTKTDNNGFKAYRFTCSETQSLYFKVSQDCSMDLYRADTSSDSKLSLLNTFSLKKGQMARYDDSGLSGLPLVAILYDTPKNSGNPTDDIFLRIMYEDSRLPKPIIMFDNDTWEVTITCADKRAEILYTLNGDQPTRDSENTFKYSGPFRIEKFTRIKAMAVYGDLADSMVEDLLINDQSMRIPRPELVYHGGKGLNEFILTNSLAGVTTYYVIGDGDIHDETQRKTFDGNPFVIEDGALLKAYSTKDLLADSEVLTMTVRHNDYVTMTPVVSGFRSEGEDQADASAIRHFIQISVPEGKAKYRVLTGKKEYQYGEEIVEAQWTECGEDWIELPGGALAGNQTVQIFAETDDKVRSAVMSYYTDWVKALKPKADYNNYLLKIYSDVPNGSIHYCIDQFDESAAIEYIPSDFPDGIDMKDKTVVYAYVTAEGYSRSELLTVYRDNFNLAIPSISYHDDGVLDISHPESDVELVVTVDPEQEYETVASNLIRFTPRYGTNVSAYARKAGFNDSGIAEMKALTKPVISIDGYKVTIDGPGEIYYTRDGSLPTKKSSPYNNTPFETTASMIRAAAFMDGYIPSEADSKTVMDQVAKPMAIIDNGYAKLSTATEGATIYYSLNQYISDDSREVYDEKQMPNGIDLSTVKTLYAYAEAEGYRRSEILEYVISQYTLSAPSLQYEPGTDEIGYVIAEHNDNEVSIRFTDGEGNPLDAEPGLPHRVKAGYNSTVYAYAHRKGYVESEAARILYTDPPKFSLDLFTVAISAKDGQMVYYTTDGKTPTTGSTKYDGNPFKVSDNCIVRAVAFADGFIPGEAEPLTIGYRKAAKPQKEKYDGRFVTFSAEDGAKLRYVLGEGGDVLTGNVADPGSPIDLEGLNKITVIAQLPGADDSDTEAYTPEAYANETEAYTSRPGVLKDAFGWCDDLTGFDSLIIHGSLNDNSTDDSGDYAFIRSLSALRHLDMSDVTDTMVPDGALADTRLVSVKFPETLRNAGTGIFGKDNTWLCAVELPSASPAPANLLEGVANTNLLLFARNRTLVDDLLENTGGKVTNFVALDTYNGEVRADEVKLIHGQPFHSPREFKATNISFTRSFTKETQIGNVAGSGWETQVVPFDVQTVTSSDRRTFKPFGYEDVDNGIYPFWLFRADNGSWKNESMILANVPYLLAFPNNPFYSEQFCVNGDVVFSASNVTVDETPLSGEMSYSFGTGNYLTGNYEWIGKEKDVLAINDGSVEYRLHTYLPGGIFISGEKNVAPFEAYVPANGKKAIPVFDQSAIDELIGDFGTLIWSESHCICIRSSIAMKLRIYDTVGQLIRIVDVKAGETVMVDDITPGIYFVGTTKILVKG